MSKLPWFGDKEYLMTWYRSVAQAISVAPPFIASNLEQILFSLTEIMTLVADLESCATRIKQMLDVGYVTATFDFDKSWGQVEKLCAADKTLFTYTDQLFRVVVGQGFLEALAAIKNLPVAQSAGVKN